MEFRSRPKSDYLQNAEWQELHVLTAHWQSDMIFFEDELRFIDVLFEKYFTAMIDKDNIDKTRTVASNLAEVKSKREVLAQRIVKHLHHIEELMVNPFAQDGSAFRNEHAALEDELVSFAKSFRDVKRQVFELTERIARTEKSKHLIAN
jgi:hypothetical protein